MLEFTGERIVPGKIDADLWNEHRSRYLFAARLARNRRVLDLGCGSGYGCAELAACARITAGLDISAESLVYARANFLRPGVHFVQSSASTLPFPDGAFDLVTAFELIEHLEDWREMLAEVRRVLASRGQFVISTPNALFYAESRRLTGPNPYHAHEFEYEAFREALSAHFPCVSLFLQNHVSGVAFQPAGPESGSELRVEGGKPLPEESNFFVAVCALTAQTGSPTYVHVPSTANVLRERGRHILLLEQELSTKNQWLEDSARQHQDLLSRFRALEEELEERNRWAASLDEDLDKARADISRLNAELAERALAYEAKIRQLETEKDAQTEWARATRKELDEKIEELARCVDALDAAERTVVERTAWAQRLDAQLGLVHASRWMRLGRKIGLGPDLRQQ